MTKLYAQFNNNDSLRNCLFLFFIFSIIFSGALFIFSMSWGVGEIIHKNKSTARLKILEEESRVLEGIFTRRLKELDLNYAYNLGFIDAGNSVNFTARIKSVAKH